MTILTKTLLALVLALTLGVVVLWWRVGREKNAGVEAAIQPAKDAAAIAKQETQQASTHLSARVDTVTRIVTHLVHDTIPATVLHPVTPKDTASAVAALPVVVAQRDSLAKICSALVVTCDEYRAKAEQRFRTDSTLNAKLEAALKARPVKKYWHLGIGPSCSAIVTRGGVTTGCGASLGYYWTPF